MLSCWFLWASKYTSDLQIVQHNQHRVPIFRFQLWGEREQIYPWRSLYEPLILITESFTDPTSVIIVPGFIKFFNFCITGCICPTGTQSIISLQSFTAFSILLSISHKPIFLAPFLTLYPYCIPLFESQDLFVLETNILKTQLNRAR